VTVRTLAARPDRRIRDGNRIRTTGRIFRSATSCWNTTGETAPKARLLPTSDLPHRRRVDFRTATWSGTIFLDQGVRSWRVQGRIHSAPKTGQPSKVAALRKTISRGKRAGRHIL